MRYRRDMYKLIKKHVKQNMRCWNTIHRRGVKRCMHLGRGSQSAQKHNALPIYCRPSTRVKAVAKRDNPGDHSASAKQGGGGFSGRTIRPRRLTTHRQIRARAASGMGSATGLYGHYTIYNMQYAVGLNFVSESDTARIIAKHHMPRRLLLNTTFCCERHGNR